MDLRYAGTMITYNYNSRYVDHDVFYTTPAGNGNFVIAALPFNHFANKGVSLVYF
jgi:hypothetical protein